MIYIEYPEIGTWLNRSDILYQSIKQYNIKDYKLKLISLV